MSDQAVIDIRNLTKKYGEFTALNNLSTIGPGIVTTAATLTIGTKSGDIKAVVNGKTGEGRQSCDVFCTAINVADMRKALGVYLRNH